MQSSETYRGWTIEVGRVGITGQWYGRAEQDGNILHTDRQSGKGAKSRAHDLILARVDKELESMQDTITRTQLADGMWYITRERYDGSRQGASSTEEFPNLDRLSWMSMFKDDSIDIKNTPAAKEPEDVKRLS